MEAYSEVVLAVVLIASLILIIRYDRMSVKLNKTVDKPITARCVPRRIGVNSQKRSVGSVALEQLPE